MIPSFDELFEASFARVMGGGAYNPSFVGDFYRRFLASSERVAAAFAGTDMSRQKTMLHDSLITLVDFNRSRRLTPEMARLAQVHSRAGNDIAPDLYDCWLDCLVSTVGDFDPQFTPEVELAWRLTLAPGIACLRFGYDQPVA